MYKSGDKHTISQSQTNSKDRTITEVKWDRGYNFSLWIILNYDYFAVVAHARQIVVLANSGGLSLEFTVCVVVNRMIR